MSLVLSPMPVMEKDVNNVAAAIVAAIACDGTGPVAAIVVTRSAIMDIVKSGIVDGRKAIDKAGVDGDVAAIGDAAVDAVNCGLAIVVMQLAVFPCLRPLLLLPVAMTWLARTSA